MPPITMRQCRLKLLEMELLDTINNAVSGMGPAAQIEWEYAASVERDNPLIAAMQGLLDWTDEQVCDFFMTAAEL